MMVEPAHRRGAATRWQVYGAPEGPDLRTERPADVAEPHRRRGRIYRY